MTSHELSPLGTDLIVLSPDQVKRLTSELEPTFLTSTPCPSEVASADEEAARKYPEKLAKIIKDGEYCAHQVFNADETGLFWKKNANPYLHCKKSEKTASGFKAAKDRVTLLLCSNASGDRMLKPLLVNRSLKPRALKRKRLKYTARYIGWLTRRPG
ncbi:tigger transposable element-derived protein 1 [Trichonephila clavipes]|nr:tigger transposable element-derived protein 1 [Trichonephila clavipes]